MSDIFFNVNEYAILFGQIDDKITREFVVHRYPEKAADYERLGQRNTPWDKRLTKFIKENPGFFGNRKVINGKGNVFRDFASHSALSNSPNFYGTLENLMVYGYDVSDEELDDMRSIFPKFKSLMETQEFNSVVGMTINYRNRIESRWRESSAIVKNHFIDILGYDISDEDKRVITFVMPPISENQRNYQIGPNKVYFFWSQPEGIRKDAREYGVTSIAHERLQHLLPYKTAMSTNQKKKLHAFIKFVANKELYSRMTGKSYLENDSKSENGEIMGMIYPYWLGYLHRKDEFPEIEIERDIKRDKEVFDRLKPNSRKRKLYESYNFEKLSGKKIAKFFKARKGMLPYEFVDIDFNIANVYDDKYLQHETR